MSDARRSPRPFAAGPSLLADSCPPCARERCGDLAGRRPTGDRRGAPRNRRTFEGASLPPRRARRLTGGVRGVLRGRMSSRVSRRLRLLAEKSVVPTVNQIRGAPRLPVVRSARRRRGARDPVPGVIADRRHHLHRGGSRGSTLDHATIAEMAAAHGRTPAQVMLRWHLQQGRQVMSRLLLATYGGLLFTGTRSLATDGPHATPSADCVPQGCTQRKHEHPGSYGATTGCRSCASVPSVGVAGGRLRGMARYAPTYSIAARISSAR
jgi:hypothetical protein